ncbi:RNA polymerase II-associated Paf1 [Penicillium maclennaniae]|uniref:RNA polymerase II-associated Paf1 n=1 Tax=Penicillium maclennaniae TaxID=1343394 RepID=UPI00254149AC|nr:RNA polymerase II-associated Paf1 [Penicillium maclennaniae]KAJ5666291.1 RNA polymerase II-associated Paf1 [Penicillium maclennaniae]
MSTTEAVVLGRIFSNARPTRFSDATKLCIETLVLPLGVLLNFLSYLVFLKSAISQTTFVIRPDQSSVCFVSTSRKLIDTYSRKRDSHLNANMSSKSKEGQSSGGFHQDYIASLRYRNDLPPPDMPPKFLDIPHEGLSRFLTPGFASNLARREEPNVDVDAEGGMPLT